MQAQGIGNETGTARGSRRARLLRRCAEPAFVFAAALAGFAAVWPVLHFQGGALPRELSGYSVLLNASAMIGTGHGFVVGSEDRLPELKAFLQGERRELNLAEAEGAAVVSCFNEKFVMSHCYLVLTLGWWWRLAGVSVDSFLFFAALFYAVTAAVLYAIFRLGCGRLPALLGVACVVTSPLWLQMAPSLRDFAKAPFVLAFLLLAAWAVARRFSARGLMVWALAAGMVLGIGWGFRQDLLACFPPALLLPWVIRVHAPRAWAWRAAASLLMAAIIVTAGAPVIFAMRADNGAVSAHTLMQGLSERSESAMSFGDASHVQHRDWGDPSAHAVAAAFARRQGDIGPMGGFHSSTYVTSARRYVAETMRTFPADFFRRGLASSFGIAAAEAEACRADGAPLPGLSPWMTFWARMHRPVAVRLQNFGVLLALVALAVGFAVNFRAAAMLAVLGVYMGAYPSLLFQSRHVFHLSFALWWALFWVLASLHRVPDVLREKGMSLWPLGRACAGMLAFLALLAGTGWSLDRLQARSVGQLLARCRAAELEPVPFRETPYKDGWVLLAPTQPVPGLGDAAKTEPFETAQALLALQLDWAPPVFPVRMVYEKGFAADFTQDVYPLVNNLSRPAALTCFLPVLELNWPATTVIGQYGEGRAELGRFIGVAVPESRRGQVRGLNRVANAAQFPLHLFITVPDDPSRFLARKSGPWVRQWALFRALRAGTPDKVAQALCAVAGRYPYDLRVRRPLEDLLDAHHDPRVWRRVWTTLASLDPDGGSEAGRALDTFAEERAAAGDLDGAEALYRTATEVDPDAHWHKKNLAGIQERLGRKDDALALYLEVLSHEPESPGLADHVDRLFEAAQDTAGRVAAWETLCARHPLAFVPAHHLALAHAAAGDAGKALTEHGRAFGIRPDHPAQLLDYGRALLDSGQWQRAMERFRSAAAADASLAPTAADLCAGAAQKRLEAGDAPTAVWLFQQALELRPDDRWLRLMTATAMKAAGDPGGALEALTALMAQSPDEHAAAEMDKLLEAGAPEDRISRWRTLAAEHPDCMECRIHLGMALETAGETEEARSLYEGVLDRDGSRQAARLRLGAVLVGLGREAEGLALVEQAVAADPSRAYAGSQVFAEVAARRAGAGELGRAEELYRRAVALAPNDGWHTVRLGEVLAKAGRNDEASARYMGLLEELPESPYCAARLDEVLVAGPAEKRLETWRGLVDRHPHAAIPRLHLGKALASLERWQDASAAYGEALRLNPGLHEARIERAVLAVFSGNGAEGLEELQAMAREPGLSGEAVMAAFDRAGRRLLEKGDPRAAVELYRAGLAAFSEAPQLLFGQSEALEQAGDRAGAVDSCARLMMVLPESPKTAARLDALCAAGDPGMPSRAVLWRRIAEAHPEAALPQLHLGLALEAVGDAAGAEAAYRKALSRDATVAAESPLLDRVRSTMDGKP